MKDRFDVWLDNQRLARRIVKAAHRRYPWAEGLYFMAAVQQLANYVQTTLASGCTNVAGTITVTSSAGHPTSGNFMIRVDDVAPATTYEYMEVTAVAGAVYTVTRGQEGTTGIAHNAGAKVGNPITAAMQGRLSTQSAYRFRAHKAAVQALVTGTWTTYAADTEDYDPAGIYDAAGTHLFTAPVTGFYLIQGRHESAAAGNRIGIRFNKNAGTLFDQSLFPTDATGTTSAPATDVQLLTAGDTVGMECFQETGSNKNIAAASYFAAHYIGSP